MTRTELIIQLLKLAIGLAFGAYFVWWSLEVLDRVAPEEVTVIDRITRTVGFSVAHLQPQNLFRRQNLF